MSMKLMFITNDPEIAREAQNAGVDRIFVDLEKIGKLERQGHLDTVISSHTMDDVSKVRSAIDESELLVRVNPIYEGSNREIDSAIHRGADIIMLPMFKTSKEVDFFVKYVDGRAKTCLLLETSQAFVRIDEILKIEGIDEIHIGLNDLYLSMGLDFIFELLSSDIVEYICQKIKKKGIRYGFGGIARIGQGMLPSDMILAEHYRIGSEMTILSRTFHERVKTIIDLREKFSFSEEIKKIRTREKELKDWIEEQFVENKKRVREIVKFIVSKDIVS